MPSEPFSIDHFEEWSSRLVLDNGEFWRLEPFQLQFVEDVFRGFRENWLIVPEGNGKTTLIAGLGLYGVRFAPDANIPIAASTRDQAKIMYRQARGFVRRSDLDEDGLWFECFDGYRRIDLRQSVPRKEKRGEVVGFMEIHAADSGSADGVIPFPYGFLDELHRHKSLELYDIWLGKTKKRGAQIVTISTAGSPGSSFEEMRDSIRTRGDRKQLGRAFLRVEGPGLVMHEHAVPAGGDATDLELVADANPLATITPEWLAEKRSSLTMTDAHWLRFTCNIAAQTEGDVFIDPRLWEKLPRIREVEEHAQVCLGADGSRTHDTTVVAWASVRADEWIDVDARVFSVREDTPHHVLHNGGRIDFDDVESFMLDLFDRFDPYETAYDPRYLERTMELVDMRTGAAPIQVEPHSKHARDAYQALFTAVLEGRIRHTGDPVIAAHLANCAVERDDRNGEIRRLRKIDPRKSIDAVPALAFAVWRATLADVGAGVLVAT